MPGLKQRAVGERNSLGKSNGKATNFGWGTVNWNWVWENGKLNCVKKLPANLEGAWFKWPSFSTGTEEEYAAWAAKEKEALMQSGGMTVADAMSGKAN